VYQKCPGFVKTFLQKRIRKIQNGGLPVTMAELAVEYREEIDLLRGRVRQLEEERKACPGEEGRRKLKNRIDALTVLWHDCRAVAVLLERYYEKGYRRNGDYTL
jgi:hypothetical protein